MVASVIYGLVVCLLLTTARCDLPKCSKVDDCSCKLDDGKKIDIRPIGYQGNQAPRFKFQSDPLGNWEYAFNPCYDFSDSYCTNVIACQKGSTESFGLGSASSAVWDSNGNQYTITYTDGKTQRTTIVNLVCSTSASQPTLNVLGQTDPAKPNYYFTLTSECACPGGCEAPTPPSSSGLSFGSILCIIFSVFLLVYFIGGICFMKFVRGAGGKEVIPNVNFWTELPGNIKGGAKFTVVSARKNLNMKT
ncbi:cation-dependent mannose-6-phosphate receptor-like [Patiria miniata]|uniref:MRH domain-containing protein n=1 Tax=Patiria miniata TaxID=46514 RepID=A0A913YZR3_PATMI|nr:cation-dependent mannose-6-phosphate receptor-like [Patiria miniata]